MGTPRRLGLGTWLVPGVSFTIAFQKRHILNSLNLIKTFLTEIIKASERGI